MKFKLLVFNATKNTIYDYASIAKDVTYTTNRSGSAGKLEFSYIRRQPDNMTESGLCIYY